MKIVLFGREGQAGTALLPRLAELGTVTALDQGEVDLVDALAVRTCLDGISPDLVVNAAAYTNVDGAQSHRELAFALNAEAPRIMAEWSARHSAALVHFSTDYVFDGSEDRPWTEEDSPRPLNVYGESKLEGDLAIAKSGCAHLIFRTSWIFAPKGKNFVLTMLKLGRERTELRVVNDQVGAPTSAEVLAGGIVHVLSRDLKNLTTYLKREGGIVNLTCSGETTWYDFAQEIFAQASERDWPLSVRRMIPISTEEFSAPARRPKNSRLSLERIRKHFGFDSPHWRDALRDCLSKIRLD